MYARPSSRLLFLLLEDADDQERRAAEENRLSDRRGLAEDLLRDLVAQEEGPPLALHVERVDEAAALLGDQVAHGAERRVDAGDVHGQRLDAVVELQGVAVLARNGDDAGGLPADRVDVLLAQADAPPTPEPFEGDGGQAGPRDRDPIPQARGVLDDLLVEPLPEGSEQRHGDGAPDNPEDRQRRPQLLTPHVAEQLAQGVFEVEHRFYPVILSEAKDLP
jgi:hypothetical protein